MAAASPARSGDELAGIAAATAEQRVRAQMALAEPLIPARRGLVLAPEEESAIRHRSGL